MKTAILYLATFGSVFFGLTSIPNIFASLLFQKSLGLTFSQVVGALISWTVMSALWELLTGQMIPILAILGSIAFILFHLKTQADRLLPAAKSAMCVEVFVIVGVGIWRVVTAPALRWY